MKKVLFKPFSSSFPYRSDFSVSPRRYVLHPLGRRIVLWSPDHGRSVFALQHRNAGWFCSPPPFAVCGRLWPFLDLRIGMRLPVSFPNRGAVSACCGKYDRFHHCRHFSSGSHMIALKVAEVNPLLWVQIWQISPEKIVYFILNCKMGCSC